MKPLKIALLFVFLFPCLLEAQGTNVVIRTSRQDTVRVFNLELATLADTVKSKWLEYRGYQWGTTFMDLAKDSTNWSDHIGITAANKDSVGWTFAYELHHDEGTLGASDDGYWEKGNTGPTTLYSVTAADTLNSGQFWKSLTKGDTAIPATMRIRFWLIKAANHALNAGMTLTVYFVRQS